MTTDDPYSFGYPDVEPERDQRTEYRLTGRANVTIELEAAEPGAGDGARTTRASSSDISTGGMRLITTEPVPGRALLPVIVELPGYGEGFPLTVEVIWCRPARKQGEWLTGLRVLDSGEAEYLAWVEAMARIIEADQG